MEYIKELYADEENIRVEFVGGDAETIDTLIFVSWYNEAFSKSIETDSIDEITLDYYGLLKYLRWQLGIRAEYLIK